MSVGLGIVFDRNDIPPDVMLKDHEGYGLARLAVSFTRSLEFGVTSVVDDRNPDDWHGGVYGPKTKGKQRKLAKQATVFIAPTDI